MTAHARFQVRYLDRSALVPRVPEGRYVFAPLVTVVVVPRERFSHAVTSLASILRQTPWLEHLVYVDAASPERTRRELEAIAIGRTVTFVRSERYLSPNEARNLGLARVRTPYAVFVDNDVVVEANWLEALIRCAEETGAAIVGPLYRIDVGSRTLVHMAGGDARIVERDGSRVCQERHRHNDVPVETAPQFERESCELVEFHTMLVRTAVLRAIGGLDEALRSVNEHIDVCMTARELGYTVYFEPASVVTYVPAKRLHASDVPYFSLRWSERWNAQTIRHFNAKWRLDAGHRENREMLMFGKVHRCSGLRLVRRRSAETRLGRAPRRAVMFAESVCNRAYTALRG